MKLIISHPTSNQFNRAAVSGLISADMLFRFFTTIASFKADLLNKLGTTRIFPEINRRTFNPKFLEYTSTYPWFELGRHIASRSKLSFLTKHEKGLFSLDSVYRRLDKHVAHQLKNASQKGATGVYAYEDGALFSFKEAKKLGLQCFYDLPIGYWRAARHYLQIESEKWPEWAPTIEALGDSREKLQLKDEELIMADRIFVASSFTANTLKEFPGKLSPIEVIPYAFPTVVKERNYANIKSGGRLKLLFVGSLSQRKGIADLFSAVESLGGHVELTIVGQKTTDNCDALNTALLKHKWIPSLSHAGVLQLMREHDVLVFPSLFEGFGLVITEAMSQGTPVITTDRTAGPDIITHGENGWLFKAGETSDLKAIIEELLIRPSSVKDVGNAAQATARSRSWEMYQEEIIEAVKKHFL